MLIKIIKLVSALLVAFLAFQNDFVIVTDQFASLTMIEPALGLKLTRPLIEIICRFMLC